MIVNTAASGGGGLQVIASGKHTIESILGADIAFEQPAAVLFVIEVRYSDDVSTLTCLPTGTGVISGGNTKYTLAVGGKKLSVRPQYSDAFDMEYLALG